ncbi:MAG: oxygen-independent coproporphyrinogen III oxidase [Cytophagales bacterium]|nr:oxygen-independent coproporphyrinogen III oxidase [Cytophagales bacterium]
MDLIEKYNVAGPRYTSYPPVPHWQSTPPTATEWLQSVQQAGVDNQGLSLYVHLPYCEHLCHYCGCNKQITRRHELEEPYINAVLAEWALYRTWLPFSVRIREIHLGGGTPTFFSPLMLAKLIEGLMVGGTLAEDTQFSLEGHPGNTTYAHLLVLRELGFERLSLGVQDFDPVVQQAINRQQSTEEVRRVTRWARDLSYTSINYDLIYGLPKQTLASVQSTMEQVRALRPDRIAFYSYAHVPWKSRSQRCFADDDLPSGTYKRQLYEQGRQLLNQAGYEEVGMDHFALRGDELLRASQAGRLHRNFMGYTTSQTPLLIGLGASAISDSGVAFIQNEKNVEAYKKTVLEGRLALSKGHLLNAEDQIIRRHILNLMCRYETRFEGTIQERLALCGLGDRLSPLVEDGLVIWHAKGLKLTEQGRPFVRNVAMALDRRLAATRKSEEVFSKVV